MRPRVLKVSTANAAFQRIEVLRRNRIKRHRYGEFVIEGVRAINGALAAGWTVRSFAYPRGRELSRWASSILDASTAECHLEVAPDLFETISEKEEPSELLAVVAMRPDSLDRLPTGDGVLVVVVDRPASPGNLGTLIRSCDAFGATGVILTGHGVDLYDPSTIRASVGSFFAVPSIALPSHREVASWVSDLRRSRAGLMLVGTSAHASVPLRGFRWGPDIVLVVGNETSGLSHAYRELCDAIVGIPMRGTATSLNAAVATSIALYELDSYRRSGL
ncbi:MAG: TrmH family RNA methyltransferase [Gemmatimonadaceae bacterium]